MKNNANKSSNICDFIKIFSRNAQKSDKKRFFFVQKCISGKNGANKRFEKSSSLKSKNGTINDVFFDEIYNFDKKFFEKNVF